MQGAELVIRLDNRSREGDVVFLLFDSPNTFGNVRDAAKIDRFASDGRDEYRISNVPPG
ncbi:MAG: hypothetical protein ACMUJM_21945 [bacterium]